MKLAKWFIALSMLNFLAACSNKDTEFFNEIALQVPNQLVLETQSSYTTQDTLLMHLAMSRYLPETGYPNLLDVYQTSGQSAAFLFSYIIEKKNTEGIWEFYSLDSNLVIETGNAVAYNGYYVGYSTYDSGSQTYACRLGMKLSQPGEYRLYFGYESLASRAVLLRSQQAAQNLVVNVLSTVSSLDNSGYYAFTVN